ncbi:MAG: N(G),N(G)-dimethylarginine dimethylaminohydrolase [Microbacteriaceae bacterium]|nr:N(G),N(G)-dimethylarginine dimethylaminohydrolase [Microbacteriaceae bacterium]
MRVLVRPTSPLLADGEVTHIERSPVDIELARRQWSDYVGILQAHGFEAVHVPAAPELPDSVFIEDTVVVFGDVAVLTLPGADSRKPETAAVAGVVEGLGLELLRIEAPGTLDGGDILKIGRTAYVGRGGRTNAQGIAQLRALLAPRGWTVVAVPMTKALHLKSAVTALPDGTVIGWEPFVDDPRIFDRFLPVPEPEGAAVVVLDAGTVLLSASAPRTAELLADLGYRVVTAAVSEFEKLEGCVTCLSVRIRS